MDDENCGACGGEPGYLGDCEHGEVEGDESVGMAYCYICGYPDDMEETECGDRLNAGCCPIGCTPCPECDCRLRQDKTPVSD